MSEPLKKQWTSPGTILDPTLGIVFDFGAAAPPSAGVNYAKGCIYVNTAGALGSFVYVNTGSQTSATWTNLI